MKDDEAVSLLREIRDLLAADEAKRDRYLEQVRRINEEHLRLTEEQLRGGRRNALIGYAVSAFFTALGVLIGVRVGLAVALPMR